MQYREPYNFYLANFVFCAVGFVLPIVPIFLLLGICSLLMQVNISCIQSWKIIWTTAYIGTVVNPIWFIHYLKNTKKTKQAAVRNKHIVFNSLQYVFMLTTFGSFLTTPEIICFASDGQNGMELFVGAWFSLPVLFLFSLVFNDLWNRKE